MRLSSSTITCPKCRAEQYDKAICTECGVVFSKLRANEHLTRPSAGGLAAERGSEYQVWVRIFQLLTLTFLAVLIVSCQQKDQLPGADFYDLEQLPDPVQTATTQEPFQIESNDQRYLIKPVQDYQLYGVVVSYHDSDSWWDIYHHDSWQDFINTRDLCVIWGGNVASDVYRKMTFENTTWTCWATWPDGLTGARFSMRQLSNNHLLTDDSHLDNLIKEAGIGDHIYLEGHLAAYANLSNGFTRGTSTRRDDTGNGACETIYINQFEVIRKANPGWRSLYHISIFALVASFLILLVLVIKSPVNNRS